MSFQINKAQREQLIGSIALIGPSGAGKTLSSLKMAYGMVKSNHPEMSEEKIWEKIGFIDTEHKRSLVYVNTQKGDERIGSYLHIDFQKPYTVGRLDEAVKALKDAGAEVVIVDSTTHFWEGDGSLQDLQQAKGGTFQAWREVNPVYNQFVSIVTGEKHNIDVISCIRSKQSYEVTTTDTGKLKVEKLGLKPVQRDSLEYEFQIVFSIAMSHVATTLKDNSGLFEDTPQVINSEVGKKIYAWLKEGKDVKAEEEQERKEMIQLIRGLEAEHNGEIAKTISDMENHKAVNMKVEDMPLNWLVKMHTAVLGTLDRMEVEKNMEEADKEVAK